MSVKRILKIFIFPYAHNSTKNTFRYAYLPLDLDTHYHVINPTNKYEKYLSKIQQKGNETLKECQESPPGSLKRKIYEIYQYSLSLLDPHELLLSDISRNFMKSEIEFIYPNCTSVDTVKEDVKEMLYKIKSQNSWLLLAYSCLVPITSLATILPGPNIFLAGNAMRIYYLWTSRKSLTRLFEKEPITTPAPAATEVSAETIDPKYPIRHVSFVPSSIPYVWRGTLLQPQSHWLFIDKDLKDQILADLAHYHKMDPKESETLLNKYMTYDKEIESNRGE
jgi:hypothetical protein